MAQITLAYPWNGHRPDETVEVEDRHATQLIRDGVARAVVTAPPPAQTTRKDGA